MLDSILITINQWITGEPLIAAAGCLLWGVISVVLSPCHMASIPLIIAYVGGQESSVDPGRATVFSMVFGGGLFLSILLVGITCSLLGRMLGDVGSYWQLLIGGVLIWVALGMFGVQSCSISGSLFYRLNLKGVAGAFILGFLYGIISGSCTFGFIAPILAIITVQEKVVTGILFIFLFALGHCLPIMAAGCSAAAVRRIMEKRVWQEAGNLFRRAAGTIILLLGVYFIVTPFLGA